MAAFRPEIGEHEMSLKNETSQTRPFGADGGADGVIRTRQHCAFQTLPGLVPALIAEAQCQDQFFWEWANEFSFPLNMHNAPEPHRCCASKSEVKPRNYKRIAHKERVIGSMSDAMQEQLQRQS